jgi:hypothetical protein
VEGRSKATLFRILANAFEPVDPVKCPIYFFVIAILIRLFNGLRAPQLTLAVFRSAAGHLRDENKMAA